MSYIPNSETPFGGTAPTPPQATLSAPSAPSAPPAPAATTLTSPESGLWIGVALGAGILLSGTQAAPLIFGLLVVGTIYQLQQLLQGK